MIQDEPANDRRFVDRRASGVTREWQEAIEQQLKDNTKLTEELVRDTKEFVQFFRAAQQGLRVLGWIGSVIKYIAPIGTAIAGMYAVYRQSKGA